MQKYYLLSHDIHLPSDRINEKMVHVKKR